MTNRHLIGNWLRYIIIYSYLYLHFTKLRRFGIPGPTPWPIFGNLLQQLIRVSYKCITCIASIRQTIRREFGFFKLTIHWLSKFFYIVILIANRRRCFHSQLRVSLEKNIWIANTLNRFILYKYVWYCFRFQGKQNTDEEWFKKYGKVYGYVSCANENGIISTLQLFPSLKVTL